MKFCEVEGFLKHAEYYE